MVSEQPMSFEERCHYQFLIEHGVDEHEAEVIILEQRDEAREAGE